MNFLDSVFDAIRNQVEKSKAQHPHDVMLMVLTAVEVITDLTEALPPDAAKALFLNKESK